MQAISRCMKMGRVILALSLILTAMPLLAAEKYDPMSDLSLGELLNLEKFMVTATKHLMPARKAPAIAAVITADEIRNMGAKDINDILRNIPGIGISRPGTLPFDARLEVRGIKTPFSEKVLFLVDGHRTNNAYTGSWLYPLGNLMVENIKRVEIIRGPGSALYGANAFIAVVNVITKSAEDIDGQQVSVGISSFNTQHYTALFSHTSDDFQMSGHLDYFDTDGAASLIEEDALTGKFGSLAPSNTLEFVEKLDFGFKVKYQNFSFNGRGIINEYGPYIGTGRALNDETVLKFNQWLANLSYAKNLTNKLDIKVNFYTDLYDQDTYIEIFPEGFTGKNDKGLIGNPILKNRTLGSEVTTNYVLGNHLLTTGIGYEEVKEYDIGGVNNLANPFAEPTPMTEKFVKAVTRKVGALYLQDMWTITQNDSLTLGIRHDDYGDFGGTTNPRIGYVHEFKNNSTLKFLYGSAFRAPTFNELYIRNNPVVVGNAALKPEKINTYEASLEYPFLRHYTLRLSYFHNDIEDIIRVGTKPAIDKPAPWINVDGKTQVDGAEAELLFKFS
ncbi:TonB-dependent receptor [Candidatus Parabeggiatoa sp. HSG14]|uniref:TonB-dependent receptor plug domain-containing protein n=1 Tax=Candidatus Parabeggiatoa sp. HSG14 TaxID=3055593 RepID=UPI0025A749D5|nr:TonB-dependent receptor [Thiotrichales bacterium HSG14]